MARPDLISNLLSIPTSPAVVLFLAPAAILLALCVWQRFKINWLAVWSSFILGALIVYPIGLFQVQTLFLVQIFDVELQSSALRAFVHTAFSEEGVKFLAIAAILYLFARRPADAVGCGLAVGLGFAAAENLIYARGAADLASLGFTRMVTAVPAHAVFGLIMGSLFAQALAHPARRAAFGTAALFLPGLLHGMYNFPLYMLAGVGAAGGNMWGYGSLFVCTIFVGVATALTAADMAMRPARSASIISVANQ